MAGAESILLACQWPLSCGRDLPGMQSRKFIARQGFTLTGESKSLHSCFGEFNSRLRVRSNRSLNSLPSADIVCSATPCSSSEDSRDPCERGAVVSNDCPLHGRRSVIALATLAFPYLQLHGSNHHVDAVAGGLDKYVKKKKLDPLDTYVPTVLLAQSQFQEVDGKLGGEQKTYADARSLLRTGPAASLRTDIRAVAQYAAETGNKDGATAVDQCLSALEDLDSLLLQASRSQGASVDRMRQDLTATVAALDKLLATVPTAILEKAREIAEAYKESNF